MSSLLARIMMFLHLVYDKIGFVHIAKQRKIL